MKLLYSISGILKYKEKVVNLTTSFNKQKIAKVCFLSERKTLKLINFVKLNAPEKMVFESQIKNKFDISSLAHKKLIENQTFNKMYDFILKIETDVLGELKRITELETYKNISEQVFGKELEYVSNKREKVGFGNIALILYDYSKIINLINQNHISLVNLDNDYNSFINANLELSTFGVDLDVKSNQINFYKSFNEHLEKALINLEKQKVYKNAYGNVTSALLMVNENILFENRTKYAYKLLPEIIPNYSEEFVDILKQNLEHVKQQKDGVIFYEDFLEQLKHTMVNNKSVLKLAENLDIAPYTNKIAQAVELYVEEYELNNKPEYIAKYYENINLIKLNVNAHRAHTITKLYAELNSILRSLEEQVNFITISCPQNLGDIENRNIQTLEFVQNELNKLQDKVNEIFEIYSQNEEKQETFIKVLMNILKNEIAQINDVKDRLDLFNAYKLPLINIGVIENEKELIKVVEVLIRRENKNYIKTEELLKTQEKIGTIESEIEVNENIELEEVVIESKKVTTTEPVYAIEITEERMNELSEIAKNSANTSTKTLAEQFNDIKKLNLDSIVVDAEIFAKNEVLQEKIEEFDNLTANQKIEILNHVDQLNPAKNDTALNFARLSQSADGLKIEAKNALKFLKKQNENLINKYLNAKESEKLAFVVISTNKKQEVMQEINKSKDSVLLQNTKTRTYNLLLDKELTACKTDVFWKLQAKVIAEKALLEHALSQNDLEEFKILASVVKLFEIASSDNLTLTDVTMPKLGKLNFQQLARVVILKYKDNKINDENTSNVVNHILQNTYNYSKNAEYLSVIDQFLSHQNVILTLKNGSKSLDDLINEYIKNGLLKPVYEEFFARTYKLTNSDSANNNEKSEENNNITI